MAAGTNWKRPWEDESVPFISQPYNTALPSNATSVQISCEDYHGLNSKDGRKSPSPMRNNSPSVISPTPYRHIGSFSRPSEASHRVHHSDSSTYHLDKRQRLYEIQVQRHDSTMMPGTLRGGTSHSLPEEGLRGPYEQECERHDKQSTIGTRPFTKESRTNGADQPVEMSNQQALHDTPERTSMLSSQNCNDVDALMQRIMVGLVGLHAGISSVLTSDMLEHSSNSDLDRTNFMLDTSQSGLQRSLEWILDTVDSSNRLAKDLRLLHSRLPNFLSPAPHDEDSAKASTFNEKVRTRWGQRERSVSGFPGVLPSQDENADHSFRTSTTPIMAEDEVRKSIFQEIPASQLPLSPHRTASSSTSVFAPPQSPAPPSSGRILPSPSSLNFSSISNVLPPISPSLLNGQSPHDTHLLDLQHQISTKSLALQILQREHDKLLAAFSRSQTRCAALDRKFQVSDAEINSLSEERIKLQEKIELFEVQVEELQQSRDEAHKQSVAKGGQYMQIMAMSSRLQAQGAADLKKWKSERDAWQQEKDELISRASALQAEMESLAQQDTSSEVPANSGFSNTVRSDTRNAAREHESRYKPSRDNDTHDDFDVSSPEGLHEEIKRLRGHCHNLETALTELRRESEHIDNVIEKLSSIGKRIRTRGPEPSFRHHYAEGVGVESEPVTGGNEIS